MKYRFLILLLPLGVFTFCNDLTFAEQDSCRHLKFASPVDGFALEGHVIKNISLSVGMLSSCIGRCTMEPHCVSFNIGPLIKDHVLCQLSDSQRIQHPDDLKPKEGFTYRGTENPCSSSPCFNNGTCQAGFTIKGFRCICRPGFTGTKCHKGPVKTCKELYDQHKSRVSQLVTLQVESKPISVLCHMGDFGCGDGGWTPVMKIDGSKSTFHYNSGYWSNKSEYNLPGGETGFDVQETKLPTYWNTSFSKICLGMKYNQQINFIVINMQARSLYSLIADDKYRATSLGRNMWKTLLGSQASLQDNCNREGFNAVVESTHPKARIGILGNEQNDCKSCDSRIGFGTGGRHDNKNTCGNEAKYSADNGDKHIKAMGYILVQ